MSSRTSAALLASIALIVPGLAQETPFVRLHDQEIRRIPTSGPIVAPTIPPHRSRAMTTA